MNKVQAIEARVGALDGMDHAEGITAAGLYERYVEDVYRYVWQRVPSVEEAEDVTAEVFAAAAAGLSRFRGQCPPYLWLLSIACRQKQRASPEPGIRHAWFPGHEWTGLFWGKPPEGGWERVTRSGYPGPFTVLSKGQTGHLWPGNPGSGIRGDFERRRR